MSSIERKYYAHVSSYIDDGCMIGRGTKIWHFCHVRSGSRIGDNCIIGQNVYIDSGAVIGNGVKIQNNVSVYNGVVIEDDVFIGPSCVYTNVINPRAFIERKDEFKRTLVKKGASIGANATVVCGNTIGQYAFVGAGAVVTKDVPDYAVVFGDPAMIRGYVCRCGSKLVFEKSTTECLSCSARYEKNAHDVAYIHDFAATDTEGTY